MIHRLTLFEAPGLAGQKAVYDQITRLEGLYLKSRKRKLPAELFSVSHGGDREHPVYGLVAYFEAAQAEDVKFLAEQIGGGS